jgi:peptidoglycan/xylan/chitin deacetylase (PgdA/CDA1 family)
LKPFVRPAAADGRGLKLLGAAAAALSLGHLLPATCAWRSGRITLVPGLAGVGDSAHVALTFDDGPDPRFTPRVLEILADLGWRATFFMLGCQVRRNPVLAKEVAAAGHEIGVHGCEHSNHLRHSPAWIARDMAQGARLIAEVTGEPPRWFRPPYGALSGSSLLAARKLGLRPVLWTTWGRDWRSGVTASEVVHDVERTWCPGATVLLHDSDVTSAPQSCEATIEALPILAERWAAQRLSVGSLGQHHLHELGLFRSPGSPS